MVHYLHYISHVYRSRMLNITCFSNIRKILFNELNIICHNFADFSDSSKVDLLLYRPSNLTFNQHSLIINASIDYILKSERFKRNLL